MKISSSWLSLRVSSRLKSQPSSGRSPSTGTPLDAEERPCTVKLPITTGALSSTITSVSPPGRFGALEFDSGKVIHYKEKPAGDGGQINAGFFVADPSVLDLIDGPDTVWEAGPLERLAHGGELMGYRHDGFWQPMDTLRDKIYLDELWNTGNAPWKRW